MASVIKLKRSSTGGAIPSASDLEVGEIALNLADRVIYSKDASSNVIRIGEAQLANTNAFITSVQSAERAALANTNSRIATVETNLTNQIASERAALANTNSRVATVETNLTNQIASERAALANTNAAIASLTSGSGSATGRIDLLNTNLVATNTAIRNLVTTNATNLTNQIATERAALANTNSAIDNLNTNLVATNTAIRNLVTTNATNLTNQIASERAALANTNSRVATVEGNLTSQIASERAALANTNAAIASLSSGSGSATARIDLLNTNLVATNTAIRNLVTTNATNLTNQIASERAALANTNAFIASVQSTERAALANTNARINNLNTTLTGSFLTKADPQSTGHFQHTGRATISTNLEVSGNTTISGNLTVEGDVAYVSTTNIEVNDPLMKLAANNTVSDVVDTGFFALYDNSGTTNFAGLFRDATDGVFKLFKDSESQPTTTVDTGATGYTLAQLDALIDGGSF